MTKTSDKTKDSHKGPHQHWGGTEKYYNGSEPFHWHDKAGCPTLGRDCEKCFELSSGETLICDVYHYSWPEFAEKIKRQVQSSKFYWTPRYWSTSEIAFWETQNKKARDFLIEHHNEPVETQHGTKYGDFVIPEAKIIVEVDEVHHNRKMNKILDAIRQKDLENEGWTVVRVPQRKLAVTLKELLIQYDLDTEDSGEDQ